MRKIQIIFAAVSAFGLSVPAPVAAQNPNLSGKEELCISIGILAESVMRARQNGVSAPTIVNQTANGSNAHELTKQLVRWAFKVPLYNTPSRKDAAISEFSSGAYIKCADLIGQG